MSISALSFSFKKGYAPYCNKSVSIVDGTKIFSNLMSNLEVRIKNAISENSKNIVRELMIICFCFLYSNDSDFSSLASDKLQVHRGRRIAEGQRSLRPISTGCEEYRLLRRVSHSFFMFFILLHSIAAHTCGLCLGRSVRSAQVLSPASSSSPSQSSIRFSERWSIHYPILYAN